MPTYAKEVMIACPPRLRSDLIIRPQQTAHGTSVVIKHPLSRKFFRLEAAEYFIAQQLDGETPVETIRQRTEAKFDAALSVGTLNVFIESLKKNDVLETADSREKNASRGPKRFRGNFLYCRFSVFDPCQLLNRLAPRVRFFYTPYFVGLSATTILLAVGVTIANWSDFRADVHRLYHLSAIPMILALNFLVVGAHEFGHGLTCTRYGGEVHEMGCALVFLQPAFYCNVSDVWLFPEKSKRLWVGLAGPYFELFLWALATITWRVTEADTWINFMALAVMATSGLKTLLNFNPLIKFDGYYLLSDSLEIPNLRKRSFRYVGSLVEKLFGLGSDAEEDLPRRERTIFLVYGTVALAGSFSILGYILLSAGNSLVDGRTPTTVLITLMLLSMKFRRRFRRMFANPSDASGSFDDEDFETAEEASDSSKPTTFKDSGHSNVSDRASSLYQAAARKNSDMEKIATQTVTPIVMPTMTGGPGQPKVLREDDDPAAFEPVMPALREDSEMMIYGRTSTIPNGFGKSSAASDRPEEAPNCVALAAPNIGERSQVPDRVTDAIPGRGIQRVFGDRQAPLQTTSLSNSVVPRETQPAPPKEEKSRSWKRRMRRAAWLALAAGALVGLVLGHAELRVKGPFNVLPIDNSDVRAGIDGIIENIYVHEGDFVRQGDVIAQLTDIDSRAALDKSKAQRTEANARLRMQEAGPTEQEIEIARAAVVATGDQLKYGQNRLARLKALMEQGLTSRKDFEDTQDQTTATANNLLAAKAKLDALLNSVRPEQIVQTKAQIQQLEGDRRHLEQQRRLLTVYSPSTGVVATPTIQLKQLTHQLVKKGDLIAKIYDLKTATVQIVIDEKDIADVQAGQKVVLRARAYPDEIFYGTVNFISTSVQGSSSGSEQSPPSLVPSSTFGSNTKRSIIVTTQIDNQALLLKPEMTGHAKILCGRKRAIDLMTRRLAHTIKVEFWSWW